MTFPKERGNLTHEIRTNVLKIARRGTERRRAEGGKKVAECKWAKEKKEKRQPLTGPPFICSIAAG